MQPNWLTYRLHAAHILRWNFLRTLTVQSLVLAQSMTAISGLQAQPVRAGHAVAIQPSDASLTVPEGPHLSLQERTAARHAFDAAVAHKQKAAEVCSCLHPRPAHKQPLQQICVDACHHLTVSNTCKVQLALT